MLAAMAALPCWQQALACASRLSAARRPTPPPPPPPSLARPLRVPLHRLLSLAVPLVLQSLASMMLSLISTIFVGHLQSPVELSGVVLASSVYNVTGIRWPGWQAVDPANWGGGCPRGTWACCMGRAACYEAIDLGSCSLGRTPRHSRPPVPHHAPSLLPPPPHSLVIGLSSALDTLCGQAFGARRYKLLGVYLQRAQCICWVLCLPIAALWLNVSGSTWGGEGRGAGAPGPREGCEPCLPAQVVDGVYAPR